MKGILKRVPSFAERVFSPDERAYCNRMASPATHFALRFAAKEAVVKALGTGFADGIGVRDIEVERAKSDFTTESLEKVFDLESIPAIEKVCMDLVAKRECKNGVVLWPLRTAVSGKQMTPGGAYEIMEILGKEESLRRIEAAVVKLEGVVEA